MTEMSYSVAQLQTRKAPSAETHDTLNGMHWQPPLSCIFITPLVVPRLVLRDVSYSLRRKEVAADQYRYTDFSLLISTLVH